MKAISTYPESRSWLGAGISVKGIARPALETRQRESGCGDASDRHLLRAAPGSLSSSDASFRSKEGLELKLLLEPWLCCVATPGLWNSLCISS